MSAIYILWVDDEIDLLRPHILFLEKRGYHVDTATNADDALDRMQEQRYDLMFLDEHMPGLSGLEALTHIKSLAPNLPIVMVTKSEEEDIMDRAVGAKISDYLIKPVNPNQILISIKKHVHKKELISSSTASAYQTGINSLTSRVDQASTWQEWVEIYKELSNWRLSLLDVGSQDMLELHAMQQQSANAAYCKFIKRAYSSWFDKEGDRPLTSPSVLREKVFPVIEGGEKVLLIVIDNLRYDQWMILRNSLKDLWRTESEDLYFAILPTVTQYARNAMFAGLMPLEIARLYPDMWVGENDPEGKNMHEQDLLQTNIQRLGRSYKWSYFKGANLQHTPFKDGDYSLLKRNDLTVIVYNFVDMLSHSRTDMNMIRQLANDANAYLSLTQSWFKHSDLFSFLDRVRDLNLRLFITTDHGSVQVRKPSRVIGDRETTTNLRYKTGKNLAYNERDVFESAKPSAIHLPQMNVSSRYIFALGNLFFAYPNNYNLYVNRYRNSFMHGGVSMEEMIVPIVSLKPQR